MPFNSFPTPSDNVAVNHTAMTYTACHPANLVVFTDPLVILIGGTVF